MMVLTRDWKAAMSGDLMDIQMAAKKAEMWAALSVFESVEQLVV